VPKLHKPPCSKEKCGKIKQEKEKTMLTSGEELQLIRAVENISRSLRRIADALEKGTKVPGAKKKVVAKKKVQISLTDGEEYRLQEEAQAAGLTVSDLLRERLQRMLTSRR